MQLRVAPWTKTTLLGGLLLGTLVPMSLVAQDATRVNIYRFILGIDVPEPPAFVALGLAPIHVLRGSAPKPIAAALLHTVTAGDVSTSGLAIDIVPYYFVGGGARPLADYRSMSIRGRLTRVLTKTLVSFGVVRDPRDPSSLLIGFGVRPTFHDPHDPVMNSQLPEEIAAILEQQGGTNPRPSVEDVSPGADLASVFARARQAMRARSGDVQLSGGWGLAGRLRSGNLAHDSLAAVRHTVWLSGQFTTGPRFDLLGTVQVRDVLGAESVWIGAGIQRKSTNVDFQVAASLDTRTGLLHPGLAVDVRVLPYLGLVTSLTTSALSPGGLAEASSRRLEFRTTLRLFTASDQ